jgi:hypothetical protein
MVETKASEKNLKLLNYSTPNGSLFLSADGTWVEGDVIVDSVSQSINLFEFDSVTAQLVTSVNRVYAIV